MPPPGGVWVYCSNSPPEGSHNCRTSASCGLLQTNVYTPAGMVGAAKGQSHRYTPHFGKDRSGSQAPVDKLPAGTAVIPLASSLGAPWPWHIT